MAEPNEILSNVPSDSYKAFAWFVSQCASGLYQELLESGKTDTKARNAVAHCFLDFAAGEACRVARSEGREPDHDKWRKATDAAFERALKRTGPAHDAHGQSVPNSDLIPARDPASD